MPLMSISERCASNFSTNSRQRGASYANNGHVTLEQFDANRVEAFVRGSHDDYTVQLERDARNDKVLHVQCECPHFDDGNICKHIWATMLKSEQSDAPLSVPGSKRINLIPQYRPDGDEDDQFWDDDDWDIDEGELFEFGVQTFDGSVPQNASSRRWKSAVQRVAEVNRRKLDLLPEVPERDAEAWFVLDLPMCQGNDYLAINLMQRERKQNGEWGKVKKLSFDIKRLNRFPDPADRMLLQQLYLARVGLGSSVYAYDDYDYDDRTGDTIFLRTEMALQTLIFLASHPRFSISLDGKPVKEPLPDSYKVDIDPENPESLFRFRLDFESDELAEEYVINGEFHRPGEVIRLDQAMLVSAGGVLLMPDRLCAHDSNDKLGWIEVLRKENAIRIPFDDGDEAMEALWKHNAVPEADLPEELRWERIQGEPKPRLRIVEDEKDKYRYWADKDDLFVWLEFLYEEHVVDAQFDNDVIVDRNKRRAIERNLKQEAEHIARLYKLPIRDNRFYRYGEDAPEFLVKKNQVAKVVQQLAAENWIVEAEGKVVRTAGEFNIDVTTGIDWFDVSATIDFGDEVSAQLPELLQALREGEGTITLSDGSQGLINADWLEKYSHLAELAESEDGKLRFRKSQALLLNALLAAQPQANLDKKFKAFRKQLRSFEGIDPKTEPRGFKGELRNYQQDGLGWMQFLTQFRFGGCLADDMGLGKTVQVLALLQSRRLRRGTKDEPKRPSLAVVPKSLIFNWIDEAARFTPTMTVVNYTGTDRQTTLEEAGDYDLLITTYGTLRRDIAELKDVPFDYAILDESQAIKNASSQTAKACRLIDSTHRLAMTGTPIENHLGELWSQFEFLNPGMLGHSKAFQRVTKQTAENPDALAALQKAIAPFVLRRTKSQVRTDLPDKVEQTLYCEMIGKQRKQYDELRQYYRDLLTKRIQTDGLKKSKIHVLEALLRLRQAACHPALVDSKQKRAQSA